VNDGSVNALARVDLKYIDARARATKAAPAAGAFGLSRDAHAPWTEGLPAGSAGPVL